MPPGMEGAGYPEVFNMFATEKVAAAPYPGRIVHNVEANNPTMVQNIIPIPMPTPDGKASFLISAIDFFAVPKSKYQSDLACVSVNTLFKEVATRPPPGTFSA